MNVCMCIYINICLCVRVYVCVCLLNSCFYIGLAFLPRGLDLLFILERNSMFCMRKPGVLAVHASASPKKRRASDTGTWSDQPESPAL